MRGLFRRLGTLAATLHGHSRDVPDACRPVWDCATMVGPDGALGRLAHAFLLCPSREVSS